MELLEGLRQRKGSVNGGKGAKKVEEIKSCDQEDFKEVSAEARRTDLEPGTYWLTRIVFLRSLGFIYCKLFQLLTYVINRI